MRHLGCLQALIVFMRGLRVGSLTEVPGGGASFSQSRNSVRSTNWVSVNLIRACTSLLWRVGCLRGMNLGNINFSFE